MLKVNAVVSTPDAYRQQQYYAGTHLAYYPNYSEERAQTVSTFENGIFKRYLEKPNGQRDLTMTSTTREKQFSQLRDEHHNREELLQQLNYQNGVHYSVQHSMKSILNL